jgi:hypothetical protein
VQVAVNILKNAYAPMLISAIAAWWWVKSLHQHPPDDL